MSGTMKAAVLHGKEDVRVEQVPAPTPGPGEVVLRTEAALTCGTDLKVYRHGYHARMIVPPALFGHEVAGVVEAVGAGVSGFPPGTRVVAANSAPCGACEHCGAGRPNLCDDLLFWNGAYAERVRIPARVVARNLLEIPGAVSFAAAAMTEPLACVLRGVEDSRIEAGQTVAVIGVGPIGLMVLVLARRRGAKVVAVGRRPDRLRRALALGAEAAVAVAPGEDLAEVLRRVGPGGRGPHVVVEAVGRPETCEAAVRGVRKGGVVNLFAGCPAGTQIAVDSQRLHYEELTVTSSFHHTPEAIRAALDLIARGEVDANAFVTGEAPLDALPEVLRRMALGDEGLKTAILPGR